MRWTLFKLAGLVLVPLVITLSMDETNRVACEARWTATTTPHRYTFLHGCEVQLTNGRWVSSAALL